MDFAFRFTTLSLLIIVGRYDTRYVIVYYYCGRVCGYVNVFVLAHVMICIIAA
jgi:hypothetical protein